MTHDPLCPLVSAQRWDRYPFSCCCYLIAKVREDMVAKCIAAVRPVAESQIRFAANLWSCDPVNCELCDCGMDSAGRQQIEDTARSQTEMVLDALRALQEKP